MAVSKIEYFGETLIDLTNDTVSADTILAGYTAHGKDGEPITGTLEVDDVTEETTAYTTKLGTQDTIIEQIVTALQNKTAVEAKEEQEKTVTPTSSIQEVVPDDGKTLSKVTVNGDSDLVAENIKKDVEIFGVTGTYEGSGSSSVDLKALVERTITSIELPSNLTKIGKYAFYGCTKLVLTSLPDSVTNIGVRVFYDCQKLALTHIPSGVTTINTYAFYGCIGLTSITFKGTPTTITSDAFQNCTNLKTINVPWSSGAVANAPWGATNATINYNYTD